MQARVFQRRHDDGKPENGALRYIEFQCQHSRLGEGEEHSPRPSGQNISSIVTKLISRTKSIGRRVRMRHGTPLGISRM